MRSGGNLRLDVRNLAGNARRVETAARVDQLRTESDRVSVRAIDPQRRIRRQVDVRQMESESICTLHLDRTAPEDRSAIRERDRAATVRGPRGLRVAGIGDAHADGIGQRPREAVLRRLASFAIPCLDRFELLGHDFSRRAEGDGGRNCEPLGQSRSGSVRFHADSVADELRLHFRGDQRHGYRQ